MRVPGTEGYPRIIGGSDLLVHNKGKNSELDEFLKDAAEVLLLVKVLPTVRDIVKVSIHDLSLYWFQEERQSRREESVGDDLFRWETGSHFVLEVNVIPWKTYYIC